MPEEPAGWTTVAAGLQDQLDVIVRALEAKDSKVAALERQVEALQRQVDELRGDRGGS